MSVIVIGSYVHDLNFVTATLPQVGETRIGRFRSGCGGKGFNQAVACARQEVETTFISALGQDLFAECAKAFAQHEQYLNPYWFISSQNTGAACVCVDKQGENQITVSLGANQNLPSYFIKEHLSEFEKTSVKVILCQLESNVEACKAAFMFGNQFEKLNILDPAPIREYDLSMIRLVDIMLPNESEFADLYTKVFKGQQFDGGLFKDIHKLENQIQLHALCQHIVLHCMRNEMARIIITLGSKGCFLAGANDFHYYKINPIDAKDTAGAGDAFAGIFAAAMSQYDNQIDKSIKTALAGASLSTTKEGTAEAMPARYETQKYFEEQENALY